MAGTEFGQAHRQIAVRAQALVEHLHMAGAIHRLHGIIALFRLGDKHIFLIVFPVAGFFPQAFIHNQRGFDFLIAGCIELFAHMLLDGLPQRPAFGVPKHHARCFVLQVEQIQLFAKPAVIAFFGLFQTEKVIFQFVFRGPSGAVNALQHFVVAVAAPISAGHFHQLKYLELAGAGHMRAAAQIGEAALAVKRQHLALRNAFDDFGLISLADAFKISHGFIARQFIALDRDILLHQFGHFGFDGGQIFRRKRALVGKVVIKALFDGGADGHLRFREQFFHRISH